jgi:hypothetical protein
LARTHAARSTQAVLELGGHSEKLLLLWVIGAELAYQQNAEVLRHRRGPARAPGKARRIGKQAQGALRQVSELVGSWRPAHRADHAPLVPALTCNGLTATIVGTDGGKIIIGTPGPDVIQGLGGNDVIRGNGGNDIICGGSGNDRLFGGPRSDRLFGDSFDAVHSGGGPF